MTTEPPWPQHHQERQCYQFDRGVRGEEEGGCAVGVVRCSPLKREVFASSQALDARVGVIIEEVEMRERVLCSGQVRLPYWNRLRFVRTAAAPI